MACFCTASLWEDGDFLVLPPSWLHGRCLIPDARGGQFHPPRRISYSHITTRSSLPNHHWVLSFLFVSGRFPFPAFCLAMHLELICSIQSRACMCWHKRVWGEDRGPSQITSVCLIDSKSSYLPCDLSPQISILFFIGVPWIHRLLWRQFMYLQLWVPSFMNLVYMLPFIWDFDVLLKCCN